MTLFISPAAGATEYAFGTQPFTPPPFSPSYLAVEDPPANLSALLHLILTYYSTSTTKNLRIQMTQARMTQIKTRDRKNSGP